MHTSLRRRAKGYGHISGMLIAVCLGLSLHTTSSAQSPVADSLRSVWNNAALPDSARLLAMFTLAHEHYLFSNPDSAFLLLEAQYAFAEKADVPTRMSQARSMQGISWAVRGNPDKAIEYFSAALEISERLDNPQGIASDLGNLANVSQMKGDYASAIGYAQRSLALYETLGDREGIVACYLVLGHFNRAQSELETATHYYTQALEISEKDGDKHSLSVALSSLASIADDQGNDSLALSYFQKSLALKEEVNDRMLMASSLKNIGRIFLKRGETAVARSYLDQSLKLSVESGNTEVQSSALSHLSELELKEGRMALAVDLGEQAFQLADDNGVVPEAIGAAEALYKAYKANQQPDKALEMYEVYVALTDSTKNEANKKNVLQQRFQYEYDKKAALARVEQEKKDDRQALIRNATLAGLGGSLVFLFIVYRQRNRISKEKERSEELLLNILPAEVAEELKSKGEADAKHFDDATILFTDFKNFTTLSAIMTPAELVAALNDCFRAFDSIVAKYRIEKIKTIGDAYMAAGGLPDPAMGKPADVVRAALDMQQVLLEHQAEREAQGKLYFEMRVGIHTGPVVAGIVGVKKFQYDIWGDTVNIAARMESSGEVGKVNISQYTYDLIREESDFVFESRGKIEAKGKGEVEMYFVSKF